jgi:L-fuconate dehydratase
MRPAESVRAIDFRHIADALPPAQALVRLASRMDGRVARDAALARDGYPAYLTSAGWLGYDDEKIRGLCRKAIDAGWNHFKIKVGADLADDLRRARVVREEIGPDRRLMLDANQVWDVDQAIAAMEALAAFDPWWIEEPTSPDDILGHARIARAVRPIGVATGEHCHNRVMFKQLMQAEAIDFVQIDGCRLGGVNEVIAVLLLAAKFELPVCPHAGGIGLCEHVQHFSAFDFIAVSGSLENRLIEYAEHLHEHFVHPLDVRGGRDRLPTAPGFGLELKRGSIERHSFPDGPVWRARQR